MCDQKGDCTRIIRTNFLHREDDENDADSTQNQEGTNADDATDLECQGDYLNEGETLEDTDENESGEEITGLEAVVTSVVNYLSNDYTDDEDDDDYDALELQPRALSAPLTCKITRMDSQQHENIHDTEPFEESQIHRPGCNNVQSAKGSHSFPKTNSPQEKEIKTKLYKNIVKILGGTDCLYKLDSAWQNLKEHPTNDSCKANYESLLAPVQTKILAHHTSLKKQHKEWEKQYYLSHDYSEPGLEEARRTKVQYSVYKNMLLCEELLKYWKITVDL